MTPQVQLILVRLVGVALILGTFALSVTVFKNTVYATIAPSIATLVFGWLGIESPITRAKRDNELQELARASSLPPNGGAS